jgi:hypothetical protein
MAKRPPNLSKGGKLCTPVQQVAYLQFLKRQRMAAIAEQLRKTSAPNLPDNTSLESERS